MLTAATQAEAPVHENPFDISPETFRAWLHRAADFAVEWLRRESRDPVLEWASAQSLKETLRADLPREGESFEAVFAEFENVVARHCRANGHPRYFAYVSASADPAGILADLLASALNQNVTAWRSSPSAASVERLVLRWLDELLGFHGGNGILTGGGSAANFNALAMAIHRAEENAWRREQLTLYVSEDTHLSIAKAARVLGIPSDNVRMLGVDAERRLRVDMLEETIVRDRREGWQPLLVCASAGTANCGAVDPIESIAAITRKDDLWLHVDGAYGAPAALTESHAYLRDAFRLADSLSIDPHKWLFVPLDTGCLLFRDGELAKRTFSENAAYTTVTQTDPEEAYAFFDHGMELSRRFRALKLWFAFRLHGSDAYAHAVARNIDLREYLDRQLQERPGLERIASDLSISCFRVVRDGADTAALNALNRDVLRQLLDGGRFLLSPTELDGRFVLRVCMVNFRTSEQDIDELLAAIDTAARNQA